ncbi:regulatory protein [Pseudomonas aeruginosa]|nr:regulatory protein [Pseudomonas aeruginosa]
MPQSIRHLIALPELRSRLLSGAGGLDRPVRWAHVCELDDPTEWLGEGDLLMTTGLGIPSDAERQRRYVRRLAEAGLAGMMIGENMEAPSDLDALRETGRGPGLSVDSHPLRRPFRRRDPGHRRCGTERRIRAPATPWPGYTKAPVEHAGTGACRRCCNASARTCEAASTSSFPTPWRPGSQACQGCPRSWPTRCATAVASRRSRSQWSFAIRSRKAKRSASAFLPTGTAC